MYIETSAPRRPNDTARLLSPVVRGNGTVLTRCVKFYYHMYGPHVNTLSVYTRSNGRYNAPLWRRNGTQGPNWRYGEVQIKTGNSFQVSHICKSNNKLSIPKLVKYCRLKDSHHFPIYCGSHLLSDVKGVDLDSLPVMVPSLFPSVYCPPFLVRI